MRTLRQGSRGTDVRDLQLSLLRLGYNPGPADGIFGFKTKQAVIMFQRDNGLTADGIVGPLTWHVLQTKLLTRSVDGWIPFWLQSLAFRSVQNHPEILQTLSPFWYEVNASGEITKLNGAEDSTILSFARTHGIKMIPLITNGFSSELISSVLNDPNIRRTHLNNIIKLLNQMNYPGIDIDYENLFVKDKEVFVLFLQELKAALSPIGKQLIVDVHAKFDPVGDWSGSEAHDYVGIGQASDLVRIMGYEYHWQGGDPGPIAPADWIDRVLAYGVSTIPKNKIVLGLPTYGYDWPQGQVAKGVTYNYAISTSKRYNAPVIEDAQLGPHFTYITTPDGINHEVWFTDAASFATLLDLVNQYDIKGICIWYLGAEDPKIYDVIRTKFQV